MRRWAGDGNVTRGDATTIKDKRGKRGAMRGGGAMRGRGGGAGRREAAA